MSKHLDVAIRAAKEAGELLLDASKKRNELMPKADHESGLENTRKYYVSKMDMECESRIINILAGNFKGYGFLAEESGASHLESDYIWVIDPIDGTISFTHGLNTFVTSIGLLFKKECVLGVVYQPNLNELFCSEKGCGAYLNGERLHISSTQRLEDSLISIGHRMFRISEYSRVKSELVHMIKRLRISESCSQEMCYVAAGKIDAFIRTMQPTYDYVMGKIIVEEAGGKVTDFQGKQIKIKLNRERNTNILATNNFLNKELISYLS